MEVVCQATLDKSVLIISSNLTIMNLRFMRVKLLLIIKTLLSKVALQTMFCNCNYSLSFWTQGIFKESFKQVTLSINCEGGGELENLNS